MAVGKRAKKISFCLIFFFFINIISFGEEKIDTEKIIYKEEINVCDMKLSDFLFYLSKEGKVEIIPEESIKGKSVDIFCREGTSLSKILSMLCESNEWRAEKEKGYIIISPRNVEKQGRGNITGRVSSLDYGENMRGVKITLLDGYSSPVSTNSDGIFRFENIPYGVYFIRGEKDGYIMEGEMVDVNKRDNSVKIFMERDYIKNKEKNTGNLKEKNDDFIIEKIKFSDIETIDIEKMFEDEIREGINFSKSAEKGIIYISGKKNRVLKIKKYLEDLDSHNKQVRITAQILDVTENLFEDLGFSWLYGGNSNNEKNGISTGVLTNSFVTGTLFSSVFTLVRNFNNDEDILKMSFNLLEGTQDLTISAVPSIVTTSGKEGVFKITEERIIGQEKTENDDNGKTTYTPIFREAGIILNVTPEIMKDNSIVLKINLETSDFKMQNYITDDEENDYDGQGGSKVSRNLETTVRMKDGDTVFIGGLKKGIIQNSESRIPFISSVPVVGALFKNSSERKEVTDLYIRLKVDIVKDGGFKDAGMNTFENL